MSVAPQGQYSNYIVYDEEKRYFVLQAQRNRPLLDAEVRELNLSMLDQVRRYAQTMMGNVAAPLESFSSPDASSGPNNAFKITQADPSKMVNNFTITGGAGLEDPAILFLNGYRVFYKGSVDYADQNAQLLSGETVSDALKRDDYTKTLLPALQTPGAARTDVVYLDLSFAEVTADIAGSEYQDPEIKDAVIGNDTANRLRAVIDIRVYEGWSGSTDATIFDDSFFEPSTENQIQHFKCPLALITRPGGNPIIQDSMITDLLELHDKRVLTNKELTHRTRHGGFTQKDVDAGRATAADVDETWGATGKNEGFGTEALNTDAVTPRVLNKEGKFKVSALVVGSSGIEQDAEELNEGESVCY
jgi:hypothetical protein